MWKFCFIKIHKAHYLGSGLKPEITRFVWAWHLQGGGKLERQVQWRWIQKSYCLRGGYQLIFWRIPPRPCSAEANSSSPVLLSRAWVPWLPQPEDEAAAAPVQPQPEPLKPVQPLKYLGQFPLPGIIKQLVLKMNSFVNFIKFCRSHRRCWIRDGHSGGFQDATSWNFPQWRHRWLLHEVSPVHTV